MDKNILGTLKMLGVRQHLLGYSYIEYAVECVISDRGYLNQITKRLYPAVAKKFDTTIYRAERAMRHAVESAFGIMPIDVMQKVFGNTISYKKGKATVSQFVAAIAEYVQI